MATGPKVRYNGRRMIAMMAKKVKSFDQQMAEALRRADQNLKWMVEHPEAMEPHVGRWVAVDKGKVIAVADDKVTLHRRFVKRPGVMIDYVSPPDQGWILRIGAPSSAL